MKTEQTHKQAESAQTTECPALMCGDGVKAGFHVGKIPDGRGFYFLPTVPDFAEILVSCRKSVPDSPDIEFGTPCLCVEGGLESSNRGLVMTKVHPRTSPTVQN